MKRDIWVALLLFAGLAIACVAAQACVRKSMDDDVEESLSESTQGDSKDDALDSSLGDWTESNDSIGGGGEEAQLGSSVKYVWAELPEYVEDDNYKYITHYAALGDDNIRNFSLCFDTRLYAAHWVAYPYHEVYDGDESRTDKWAYDPLIDTDLQANLTSSYTGDYDRGHQLPSADRTATVEMNHQTFYYSNMTPQWAQLNRRGWAYLEQDVRDNVCSDTLYVVTGAHFAEELNYTTDKSSKMCPIPSAYYKVLLRTKSGDSGKSIAECSVDELMAIGFWIDHEEVTVSQVPDPITVKEIEEKTGFSFFPMVPQEVKADLDASLWKL